MIVADGVSLVVTVLLSGSISHGAVDRRPRRWQQAHDEFVATGVTRAMTVIIKDLASTEVFRWNLFEFALTQIAPGDDGRMAAFRPTPATRSGISATLPWGLMAEDRCRSSRRPPTESRRPARITSSASRSSFSTSPGLAA
jgi:hypothetical protein